MTEFFLKYIKIIKVNRTKKELKELNGAYTMNANQTSVIVEDGEPKYFQHT